MEELKKKIFNILLNHSHASRTIATEELYELFVSKSKNSAGWVKASERLPGWDELVEWRFAGKEPTAKETVRFLYSAANIHQWEWLDESGTAAAGREEAVFDSKWLIGRSEERFKELAHKGWDWRSFYNGWIEGRSDAWCDFRGKESAVEFAEWVIREGWATSHDRKGWMKHSDETPYVLTTAELYELFKQQKEKQQ